MFNIRAFYFDFENRIFKCLYSRNMQHVLTRKIKTLVVVEGNIYVSFTKTRVYRFVPNGFRTGVTVDRLVEGTFDRHRYLLLAGVCPSTKPM